MKKMLFLLIILIPNIKAHSYCPSPGKSNESPKEAEQRFDCMSARQMSNLNIHELTSDQLLAFKKLAKKIFHAEVATPSCDSQANRIKYEIMYQKLGELHPAQKT